MKYIDLIVGVVTILSIIFVVVFCVVKQSRSDNQTLVISQCVVDNMMIQNAKDYCTAMFNIGELK